MGEAVGKCPSVQPRAFSCSSSCGPSTPAWTRAMRDSSSIESTRSSAPRSTEITLRVSPGEPRGCPRCSCPRRTGSARRRRPSRRAARRRRPPRRRGEPPRRARDRRRRRGGGRDRAGSCPRVHEPVQGVGRHALRRPRPRAPPAAHQGATARGWRAPRRPTPGRRPIDVDGEMALEERPERRLAVVGECHPLVSPAPPLHPW